MNNTGIWSHWNCEIDFLYLDLLGNPLGKDLQHNRCRKCKCLWCYDSSLHSEHLLHNPDRVDLHTLHLLHMQGDQNNLSLLCILKDWMWQNDEFKIIKSVLLTNFAAFITWVACTNAYVIACLTVSINCTLWTTGFYTLSIFSTCKVIRTISVCYAFWKIAWCGKMMNSNDKILSLIHIWRCRRSTLCRSRWSPYH